MVPSRRRWLIAVALGACAPFASSAVDDAGPSIADAGPEASLPLDGSALDGSKADASCSDGGGVVLNCGLKTCGKPLLGCGEDIKATCRAAFPAETCNNADDDCDGEIDEGATNCKKDNNTPAGRRCNGCFYSYGSVYLGDASVVTTTLGSYTTRMNDQECSGSEWCGSYQPQWIMAFANLPTCNAFCSSLNLQCANACTTADSCSGSTGKGMMQAEQTCHRQGACSDIIPAGNMAQAFNLRCCCEGL